MTRRAAVGCGAVQRWTESPEGQRRRGSNRGICFAVRSGAGVCVFVGCVQQWVSWLCGREGGSGEGPAGDGMAHHLASSLPAQPAAQPAAFRHAAAAAGAAADRARRRRPPPRPRRHLAVRNTASAHLLRTPSAECRRINRGVPCVPCPVLPCLPTVARLPCTLDAPGDPRVNARRLPVCRAPRQTAFDRAGLACTCARPPAAMFFPMLPICQGSLAPAPLQRIHDWHGDTCHHPLWGQHFTVENLWAEYKSLVSAASAATGPRFCSSPSASRAGPPQHGELNPTKRQPVPVLPNPMTGDWQTLPCSGRQGHIACSWLGR